MPVPEAHYRVALGDYEGEHSWIVQSGIDFVCKNVPEDLSSLLRTIDTHDLLDFSLGSGGRYYVKYLAAGREKRKLSRNMWREIDQDHNSQLDRLTLGPNGQHWGVRRDPGSCVCFADVDECGSFSTIFASRLGSIESFDEVEFVALGADGDWAFAVNGWVECRRSNLLNRILAAKRSGKKILSMAMSPISHGWFISYDYGDIDYHLPEEIAVDVETYCQRQYSLLSPITLRILPPRYTEYWKIASLFENGWSHGDKILPTIVKIFAVELPGHLNDSYSVYRSLLLRKRGVSGVNEKLAFHGTPRNCYLGDGDSDTDLCLTSSCSLCGVLRESFSVACAGTAPDRNFLRFGHGIYTTSVSSKADDYTDNLTNSQNRVLIVAKALLGRAAVIHRTTQTLMGPPAGFDSVLGGVGVDLNYDEQVLYRDDAIRPAYLIVYEPEEPSF